MDYSFDINYAKLYGVDEAIMIKNFQYWIIKNKANNINLFEGRTWTYNSVKSYTEIFPFWTHNQIDRILTSLRKQSILITGNFNKARYDRTRWYAFSDESSFIDKHITISANTGMESGKSNNAIRQKTEPIPITKTTNTNTIYYKDMIAIYDGFCKEHLDIPASINGAEGSAMKTIIKRLIEIARFKGHEDSGCLDSFRYILGNWNRLDDFTQKQTKLTQISSNLTNIITQLKSGKEKSSSSSLADEILAKYR